MKWFYVLTFGIAAVLGSFPFMLLSGEFGNERSQGIVYRVTYSSAVKSIDPATCGDETSANIQSNVYEGLYAYHYLKRPVEVIPRLAAEMPRVSPDGLLYTIPLKRGVLYHRNPCFGPDPTGERPWSTREMRAADFVYAFKRIADYHINTGLAWAFLADRIVGLDEFREKTKHYKIGDFSRYDLPVEGLTAPDDSTLCIRLRQPFPQLVYVLAVGVYAPIPHEVVDYWLASDDDGRGGRRAVPVQNRSPEIMEQPQVVGTGPYLLKEWRRKWKIILARNPEFRPDYYPSEGERASETYPGDSALGLLDDAGKRVPFADEVQYRYMEEEYANWMMFLSKQVDAAGIPSETFDRVIRPDKELAETWKDKGIFLSRAAEPSIFWIAFNMEDPVLGASKALRQAICLGYDVENELRVVYNNRGKRPLNIVPSMFEGYAEAGPSPFARYDLAASKEKLAQARQELDRAGQLRNGDIPELVLDLSDGPSSLRQADFIRGQFSKMGLKLKIVFNDWPTLQRKVNNKQVQMYMMGWIADYPDAENFLQLYYSGNIDKGTNNCNYRNPVFDSLYERIRVMPGSPERTELYARMIRILNEDCPVLLTMEPEVYALFNRWVYNVKQHPIGHGYLKYRRIDAPARGRHGGKG